MNKILVIPGSKWQIPLVQKIKEMGYAALVANPYEDSPCFAYADGHLQSDIFALDAVTDYARKQQVDAIMSDECDIAMPVVAQIGERLGLPALSPQIANLYTDKFMMREFSKKHAILYPEYQLCYTLQEALEFFRQLKRPMIIKPLDSNASHGVFKIETESELLAHFDESMSFSRIEAGVLAERYIEGTEFTIDGVKTPEAHFTLAISEKRHFAHNINIASDLLFSHSNDRFDYEALKKINDAFVMQSGLAFGFTHAEFKCEDGQFYLIEIAARGGGNLISSVITQYLSGYDTYRYLVECSLGNVTCPDFSIRDDFRERAAILKFFPTPNGGGKVREIRGLEKLDAEPDIVSYDLNFRVGDVISDCISDSARIGYFIACSKNMDKLQQVISMVEDNFQIVLDK